MKLKGSLGCSDHELVVLETFTALRRAHSKLPILDFRKADLGLFRDLLGKVPGNKALEKRETPESWLILKKEEVRQNHQEASLDEQGAPGQSQTQKESWQRVEARTGSLRGAQWNCLSYQRSC